MGLLRAVVKKTAVAVVKKVAVAVAVVVVEKVAVKVMERVRRPAPLSPPSGKR
jgi:hypothetical protein